MRKIGEKAGDDCPIVSPELTSQKPVRVRVRVRVLRE